MSSLLYVQTNDGKTFLGLIEKHVPRITNTKKIFNKNTAKVNYSSVNTKGKIIENNTTKTLRNKDNFPLDNNCRSSSLVYNANVTTMRKTPRSDRGDI